MKNKIAVTVAGVMAFLAVWAGVPLGMLVKYGENVRDEVVAMGKEEIDNEVKEADEGSVDVYVKNEDKVINMQKSQYLKEVVAAEMPADFELEALKAQAVAARSYLEARRNAYKVGGTPEEHKGGEICTDSTHCKAWISEVERKEKWGEGAAEKWEKISLAVDSTANEVITYDGEVVSAVFHSTSSGRTENSKDVWGGDVPYLVSVESVEDEKSPKFNSELTITVDEFKEKIKAEYSDIDDNEELISDIVRSDAGGIISVTVMGKKIKGTKFRTIFGLRSTNAEPEINGDTVEFKVKGYGHGVGMSQYGANYLAADGADYKTILKKYYTGIEIGNLTKLI